MNITSLLGVFGAVVTAFGGYEGVKWLVNFLAHRKQNKQMEWNKVHKSSVENEKATRDMYEETLSEMRQEYVERINELRGANAEQNKQNLELIKAGARKDEIIEDKTLKIRELQDELLNATKTNGELEKKLQWHENWHCKREFGRGKGECMRREPAQNPPLKYEPLE